MDNLYLTKIKKEDIDHITQRIKEDFTLRERIPKNILARAFNRGMLKGFYLTDDEVEYGYIVYDLMEKSPYAFIMYLAIDEEYRDRGYGTKLLTLFKEKLGNKKIVLLADDPLDCKNYEENQIRDNRIKFYEKNDMEIVPNTTVTILGIRALVLTDSKNEIRNIDSLIYKVFWRTLGVGCMLALIDVKFISSK